MLLPIISPGGTSVDVALRLHREHEIGGALQADPDRFRLREAVAFAVEKTSDAGDQPNHAIERVRSGLNHYRPCEPAALLLRYHLAQVHHLELPDVAYTLEDFKHDTLRLLIEDVEQFTPEERAALLKRMDAEDRLRGLPTEEILRGLQPDEILRGLDPDVIKAWLERTGH